MTTRSSLAFLVVIASAQPAAPQSPPSIYQRQTTIKALITGSPGLRDGGYQASGTSSICGVIPREASLTGEAVFVVEFPSETPRQTPGSITSIAFGSSELASGRDAKASRFRLNVNVVNAMGGQPPAYVLNTDPPRLNNTGVATLTRTPGVTTLNVGGKEEGGETIDLTVTCR